MSIRSQFDLAERFEIYNATKPKGWDREFVTCPFHDAVGIEVEVENVTIDIAERNSPQGWSMVGDGSLRNNGQEFITKPTTASSVHWSLGRLLEKHLDSKEQSFSPRTSIHVHVNCRDLELFQVQNVIRYYALFERLLFRFCGRSRYKNIYCVPLVDTTLMTSFRSAFPNTNRWPKYAGLNAAPLTTQGTLEFRHMHGTFDVDKIMTWVNLVLSVFNYAKGLTFEQAQAELVMCASESQFLELSDRVFKSFRNQLFYKNVDDYIHCYNNMLYSFVTGNSLLRSDSSRTKTAFNERFN